MTVGQALWPEQLTDAERAQLNPGIPPDLDRRPDILVVGGGMLGVATALACVQARLGTVVLVERDRLGAGASGGAAGQLVPEAHFGDPPALFDLARLSLNAWREFEASVPGGVGLMDIDWLGLGAVLPTEAEPLGADAVAQLVPGLTESTPATLVRHQARVNPLRSLARMAAALPCVATGIGVHSATVDSGRITAVQTSAAEIRPGSVVFATGNPPRIDGLDLRVPWSEVKGHMLVTEPTHLSLPGIVAPLATLVEDGRLMRGGTLDVGDDERVVRPEVVAAMWAEVEAAWPVAQGLRISHQWACFRPAHPDRLAVIDRVPALNNAWITSGHYMTGILLAPATGRALAAWIGSGERPSEVVGFGIDRFSHA